MLYNINGIAKATQMWPSMTFYVCHCVTPYGNNIVNLTRPPLLPVSYYTHTPRHLQNTGAGDTASNPSGVFKLFVIGDVLGGRNEQESWVDNERNQACRSRTCVVTPEQPLLTGENYLCLWARPRRHGDG